MAAIDIGIDLGTASVIVYLSGRGIVLEEPSVVAVNSSTGDVLCVGAWAIDRAARTLTVDGAEVPLTRTEFNIVELLAAHPRKVYTKQELFELAWGEPYAAEDSTVSVHVSNIRAKLKPTGTDGYVQTVWGLGFKLAVDEGA